MTVIPINRKLDQKIEKLLAAHQAIIDAWYAGWLRRQQKRADEWAKRKGFPGAGQA